jgi:hypothetical protein
MERVVSRLAVWLPKLIVAGALYFPPAIALLRVHGAVKQIANPPRHWHAVGLELAWVQLDRTIAAMITTALISIAIMRLRQLLYRVLSKVVLRLLAARLVMMIVTMHWSIGVRVWQAAVGAASRPPLTAVITDSCTRLQSSGCLSIPVVMSIASLRHIIEHSLVAISAIWMDSVPLVWVWGVCKVRHQ